MKRDQNRIVVGWGVSSVDGVTPVPITIDPVSKRLRCISVGSTTVATGDPVRVAPRDGNGVPAKMGVDSSTGQPLAIRISPDNYGVMMKAN